MQLKKDLTKSMFANALVEMLQDMPLEKVRVTKLCEHCGTTPPTFYYYFRDKYELVVWIFLQDVAAVYSARKPDGSAKGLSRIIRQVKKKKTFYQKAFTDQSQNSLSEYAQSFIIRYYKEAIRHDAGEDPTPEQLFAIKYHMYGILGMFREWLYGQDTSFEEMSQLLYERSPDFLRKAFASYPLSAFDIYRLLDTST